MSAVIVRDVAGFAFYGLALAAILTLLRGSAREPDTSRRLALIALPFCGAYVAAALIALFA